METEAQAASDKSPSPSSAVDESFSKPRPRAPRSPAQAAQVRKTNRRQEFLERHPSYFDSLEHELAVPILYDKLIRRFQTAQEREKEGKTKGYSRVLEVDLLRGEAKLSQLAAAEASENGEPTEASHTVVDIFNMGPGTPTAEPETKEEGRERWNNFLRERFTSGRDEDFDYDTVDADDSLDVLERRDEEEAWFNDEAPGWASDGVDDSMTGNKQLQGETGIQDF